MKEQTKKGTTKNRLYLELEKKYEEEHLKVQEQERQEKLKKIKDQYKPVSKDEIEYHSRKYDDLLRQQKDELRRKRGVFDYASQQDS